VLKKGAAGSDATATQGAGRLTTGAGGRNTAALLLPGVSATPEDTRRGVPVDASWERAANETPLPGRGDLNLSRQPGEAASRMLMHG
jgi:hypothetical protein